MKKHKSYMAHTFIHFGP